MYISAKVPMIEKRQREAGDDRRPDIAQEHEDHHDDQRQRQQHGELHVAIRFANRVRAIVEDVHVDARRQLELPLRHQRLDGVGDGDGVGAGLALDAERNRPLRALGGVEPGRRALVFDAVLDVAQLAEAHRRAVAVGDDHVLYSSAFIS